MGEWFIELEGEKKDLRLLSELLNSPNLDVTEEKGAFILCSSTFDPALDSNAIDERSTNLIEVVNGAAKLYSRRYQGVTAKAVVRIDEDGKRLKYVTLTARARDFTLTARGRDDLVESWFSIAQADEHVTRALTLYGSLEHNWKNLYMLLEVIEADIGGEGALCGKGWVSKKKIKGFKHTANSFSAIGRDARHGHAKLQPPKTPMLLQDARMLIRSLLRQWLESKEPISVSQVT